MDEYSFDLHRIFIGDLPWAFYLEIVLRTSVMFLFALALLRLMGKRNLAQLSAFDFVIIIALGSAVGDPMLYDDVPILYGMLVVSVVVGLERFLAVITMRHRRIERFVDSAPSVLIRHGVIDQAAVRREFMSRHELNEALRLANVDAIDDVELAILEPSGRLSVLTEPAEDIGLWNVD